MADDDSVFPGFWHPDEQQGYTQLPHELIELLPKLGEAELKIILYIFRHTWGFQEFGGFKKITIDEFMYGRKQRKIGDDGEEIIVRMDNGTGLSDWGVKDGIAKAIKHGYVVCKVNDRDKARIKKMYGLKIYVNPEDEN